MSAFAHKMTGGLHHLTLRPSRRFLQLLGMAVVALAIGTAIGYASGDNTSKVNALNAKVTHLQAQAPAILAAAKHRAAQDLAAARSEISSERQQASDIVASAHQRASGIVGSARQQAASAQTHLKTLQGQISAASGHLSQLESQINGAKATIAKDTIPGDGTFLVGSDINPGTYRAAAMPGCYWARLASLDTSNIIDNNNADGPVVVQIAPTDKAFQTTGCASFHRIGP